MITILGAGMAGLLAANMLRHEEGVSILEKQSELPNNHSAVLRFRSTVVGDVLNIPFKSVSMIKATMPWRNVVADSLSYSRKNTGVMRSDRSIIEGLVRETRYIAPPDFIAQMARSANIAYDCNIKDLSQLLKIEGPKISTIPMPALMRLLDYKPIPDFPHIHGTNIVVKLKSVDAYVTLMVPDPTLPFSRLSLTGDTLIIEVSRTGVNDRLPADKIIDLAIHQLGIMRWQIVQWEETSQSYSKILPIDDEVRKSFLHYATVEHNVYSLGRFATWRPGLLLDDLVKDVRLIARWIKDKSKYEIARHR